MDNTPITITVGLWGATGAGKTTFVASLGRAPLNSSVDWSLGTVDQRIEQPSEQASLGKWQNDLNELRFPPSSQAAGETYTWIFQRAMSGVTTPTRSSAGWRFKHWGSPEPAVKPPTEQFRIEVRDVAGELFSLGSSETNAKQQKDIMDRIRTYDGLILLVDPVPDSTSGRTDQIGAFMAGAQALGPIAREKFVAACITKMDDSRFFYDERTRWAIGPNDFDSRNWPERPAPPPSMRACFEKWAPEIYQGIGRYFDPARLAYYVTTPIGFRASNPGEEYWSRIDWSDVQNSRMAEELISGGQADPAYAQAAAEGSTQFKGRINTSPTPINVLEPFLWMYEQRQKAARS